MGGEWGPCTPFCTSLSPMRVGTQGVGEGSYSSSPAAASTSPNTGWDDRAKTQAQLHPPPSTLDCFDFFRPLVCSLFRPPLLCGLLSPTAHRLVSAA